MLLLLLRSVIFGVSVAWRNRCDMNTSQCRLDLNGKVEFHYLRLGPGWVGGSVPPAFLYRTCVPFCKLQSFIYLQK